MEPRTTTQRTAYITLRLAMGEKLRTADVARKCGMTRQGAYKLLDSISGVTPLALDDGEWYLLQLGEGSAEAQTPR